MRPTFRFLLPFVLCASFVASVPSLSAETLIEDKFTSAELPKRNLSPNRGEWKLADGIATCTQDDALYAKNKNHGPVIWYDVTFTDATVKFAFKPEQTKSFVFTLNDDKGHDFRFVMSPAGLSVRTWPEQGHEATAISLLTPKPGTPALMDGVWVQAELKFEGKRCTMKLGDFQQTFEHDAIARTKVKLGLGFSFGTLAVRDVSVTTP
jgi:hypothetical protein